MVKRMQRPSGIDKKGSAVIKKMDESTTVL
jgi:hypothetical protein